jgi:hypothetical protein
MELSMSTLRSLFHIVFDAIGAVCALAGIIALYLVVAP